MAQDLIHEGNGTFQLFLTKNITEQQKNAVVSIFSGQAKGDGPFALFATTYKYILEPQLVDLHVDIDGKRRNFRFLVCWMSS